MCFKTTKSSKSIYPWEWFKFWVICCWWWWLLLACWWKLSEFNACWFKDAVDEFVDTARDCDNGWWASAKPDKANDGILSIIFVYQTNFGLKFLKLNWFDASPEK